MNNNEFNGKILIKTSKMIRFQLFTYIVTVFIYATSAFFLFLPSYLFLI